MRTPAETITPDRRRFLRSAGWSALALSMPPALGGCASRATAAAAPAPAFAAPPPLAPIFATADRMFGDASLVPVRGQTARLIPQPEVGYGLAHGGLNLFVVPRGDGILVQTQEPGDYGDDDTTPDPSLSAAAVQRLAELFR